MLSRLRCPQCREVFEAHGARAACPVCGFQARVPGAAPATPAARTPPARPRRVRSDRKVPWVPLAVFGVVLVLIVALIAVEFSGDGERTLVQGDGPASDATLDGTGSGTPVYDAAQDPAKTGTLQDAQETERPRLLFSGSGEGTTEAFTVTGGVLRVELNHYGTDAYFVARFMADSKMVRFLGAPAAGTYEAVRYTDLPNGTYTFDVTADGSWSIAVSFPTIEGAVPATEGLSGDGPDGPGPVWFEAGDHSVQYVHEGTETFHVRFFRWDGAPLADLSGCFVSDWPGAYDRTKTCTIDTPGAYFLDVEASGPWSVRQV